MKKILTFASAIFLLSSFNSNAKTEGSYLSADVIRSQGQFYESYVQNGEVVAEGKPTFKRAKGGFGFTYKYAFNHRGAFLAPGIFYERNNLVINKASDLRRLEIQNRFGGKVDLGVDLSENFAIYAIGGYSGIDYSSTNYSISSPGVNTVDHSLVGNGFYGAGMKVDFNQNFAVIAEYTTQKFSARTKVPNGYNGYSGTYKARLDVAKIGFAYRF